MKSRIIGITLFFIMLIAGVSVFFVHNEKQNYDSDSNGELIVSLNEVEQLINMGETQKAAEKAALLKDTIRRQEKPVRENSASAAI